MKNTSLLFMTAAVALVFLSGCTASNFSLGEPTPKVIGETGKKEDHKVVTFNVIGKGLEPENALTRGEAKLQAERAAVVDGYRMLAEKLRGVYVDAYMETGKGTVNYDMIRTHTQAWLRGAEVLQISEGEYGITRARMRLSVNFTKKGMVWWPVGVSQG